MDTRCEGQETRPHRPWPAPDHEPRLRRRRLEDALFHQRALPRLGEPQDRRNPGASVEKGLSEIAMQPPVARDLVAEAAARRPVKRPYKADTRRRASAAPSQNDVRCASS